MKLATGANGLALNSTALYLFHFIRRCHTDTYPKSSIYYFADDVLHYIIMLSCFYFSSSLAWFFSHSVACFFFSITINTILSLDYFFPLCFSVRR